MTIVLQCAVGMHITILAVNSIALITIYIKKETLMQQKHILFSILLIACNTVLAADAVDSAPANSTTPVEQAAQKSETVTQTGLPPESPAKGLAAASPKRSRVEQDNFQQSTSNAQDLFQGDHN